MINKWYRVVFEESFYDDMVGNALEIADWTITLYFGDGIGTSIFYKNQVIFEFEEY